VNLASFDLNLLLVLEALLVERSATRAGKRVGLSQSAVSNALSRLRTSLGDPMFVRSGVGMAPTAFALSLAGPLQAALDQLRNVLGGPPPFDASRTSYRARFATTDYAEVVVLAPLARQVRSRAPSLTLDCRRLKWAFELPLALLEKGEIDFALGHFGPVAPGHGLRSLHVMTDRWALLSDAKARRMTLARFAARPQTKVMYGADGPGIVGEALRALGKERVTPIVTSHFSSVPHFVKGTDLLGIVPERLALLHARALDLSVLRPPLALPIIHVTLVWHERHQENPPHAWVRARLLEVGREAPPHSSRR
jgi:DNA-binding transcriptional LysR family regulator